MDFAITLENRLFPVQAFFNAMPARSFFEALENFAKGIGAGFNDAVCEFPDELDEDEEKFTGVKFYIFNEELIVSNADCCGQVISDTTIGLCAAIFRS